MTFPVNPVTGEAILFEGKANHDETLLVFITETEKEDADKLPPQLRHDKKLHGKTVLCLKHSDIRNRIAAVEAAGLTHDDGVWEQLHNTQHAENFKKFHNSRVMLECQVCNGKIEDQVAKEERQEAAANEERQALAEQYEEREQASREAAAQVQQN